MVQKGELDLEQMQFDAVMKSIISMLETAGYDPYMQLKGFVMTGKKEYITRQGGARDLVERLDPGKIKAFLETYNNHL